MTSKSSPVVSNQITIHEDLKQVVTKHLNSTFKKPYRDFSTSLFEQLDTIQAKFTKPIILDSGCGTGDSTFNLAEHYPEHLIIGIDKSASRLKKYSGDKHIYQQDNLLLARGDVIDIWRMARQANWKIDKHFLLYPNPWPKKDQLKRRWHGHPVFPELITLCEHIELRTNWKIYAEEFKQAFELITNKNCLLNTIQPDNYISLFEKKYFESGHSLICLKT